MPRVVCTSKNAEHGPHHAIFQEAGFDCDIVSREVNLFDEKGLLPALGHCEAIVAGAEPYTRRIIESQPDLRVIARTGVGFDAIDLQACDEHGVVVTTTPGVNHHAVAEHAIALLFGVARGFPEVDQQVRECRWKRIAHPRVMGRTIGIVGLGRIGRALAWRVAGLGMKVLAFEPSPDMEFVTQWHMELVELDDLLARSDYVSLHCPLAPETRHLINRESLSRMKLGAVLINTSRGGLVDEAALLESLESGHLRGAGLDVFETEPLPADSPLIRRNDVLLAGHVAGLDEESHDDTFAMAAETVVGLSHGKWPAHCIQNLEGTTNWSWNDRVGGSRKQDA